MKKKLSMTLAMAICGMTAIAPMNVSAYKIRSSDELVLEKDTFQYGSGVLSNMEETMGRAEYNGYYLNLTNIDANFMVSGVFLYESGRKYYTLSPVNEINEVNTPDLVASEQVGYYSFGSDTRGITEAKYMDALLDGKELAIGDLVKISNYQTLEGYPMQYSVAYPDYDIDGNELIPSAEYVGNTLELLGEEFKEVLVNEMYLAPNYVIGGIGVRESAELIDSNHIVKKGDVTETGTVGVVDVLAINQYLLGIYHPSNYGILSADVNRNGTVEDEDAMMILKSLVGLETLE